MNSKMTLLGTIVFGVFRILFGETQIIGGEKIYSN